MENDSMQKQSRNVFGEIVPDVIKKMEVKEGDTLVRSALMKLMLCIYDLKESYLEFVFAFSIFRPVPVEGDFCLQTNGRELYFCPVNVLRREDRELKIQILHICLHGLLGHFWDNMVMEDKELAWAVMDIKVERLIGIMLNGYDIKHEVQMRYEGLEKLSRDEADWIAPEEWETVGMELYYRAAKNEALRESVLLISRNDAKDNHAFWETAMAEENGENGEGRMTQGQRGQSRELWEQARQFAKEQMIAMGGRQVGKANLDGNDFEQMLTDAILSALPGSEAGLSQTDVTLDRKKPADYKTILESLEKLGESCGEEDVPDPIYYSYGLELYGDIPLIEPLEEAERSVIDTLVVAVDTSGSCWERLNDFMRETKGFLEQMEGRVLVKKLWYMECDSQIQAEEFFEGDRIMSAFTYSHDYRGGGGTDFQPVFERIEKYKMTGKRISGLIYYSDAEGDFPQKKPDYPCFFVMPTEDEPCSCYGPVPDWVTLMHL